jgi:hypothetical protein
MRTVALKTRSSDRLGRYALRTNVGKFDPLLRNDNAVLKDFFPRWKTTWQGDSFLLPEHGPMIASEAELCVRPSADIFHFGLWLWMVASYWTKHTNFRLQRSGGRNTALAPLPDEIPGKFNDMVNACRRNDPHQRPAARELLDQLAEMDKS